MHRARAVVIVALLVLIAYVYARRNRFEIRGAGIPISLHRDAAIPQDERATLHFKINHPGETGMYRFPMRHGRISDADIRDLHALLKRYDAVEVHTGAGMPRQMVNDIVALLMILQGVPDNVVVRKVKRVTGTSVASSDFDDMRHMIKNALA